MTKGPHKVDFFMIDKQKFLIFKRPNLDNFLEYLFEHFNVGFWTTGTTNYAKKCLELIQTKEQRFKKR